jgi:5-methylcytosine-specific restriction endonuclease McrA
MKLCAGSCRPKARVPIGTTLCGRCEADRQVRRLNEGHTGQNGVRRDQSIRRRIVQRDGNRCVACGITEGRHRELYGSGLQVHHRDGDPRNNDPTNLETRCRSCHNKADATVKKQRQQERPQSWAEAREKL